MRLSTDKDDPGYVTLMAIGGPSLGIEIYLDGQKIDDVETVDTAKGLIVRYATDATGKIRVEGNEIVRETLRGVVRIMIPADYVSSFSSAARGGNGRD